MRHCSIIPSFGNRSKHIIVQAFGVYEHNWNGITITPSANGLATIWDKDVLLFTICTLIKPRTAVFLPAITSGYVRTIRSCTATRRRRRKI